MLFTASYLATMWQNSQNTKKLVLQYTHTVTAYYRGHFQVAPNSNWVSELNHLEWYNEFDLHENSTHPHDFHLNGCVPGLDLILKQTAIQKWTILRKSINFYLNDVFHVTGRCCVLFKRFCQGYNFTCCLCITFWMFLSICRQGQPNSMWRELLHSFLKLKLFDLLLVFKRRIQWVALQKISQ